MSDRDHSRESAASGLAQGGLGGLGGPEDQLLEAGQEEVFAREEVETGRIEHHSNTQTQPDDEEIEPSSPNAGSGAAGAA